MGFERQVVFANPANRQEAEEILMAARQRWPWCIGKVIDSPIFAAAMASQELTCYLWDEKEAELEKLHKTLEVARNGDLQRLSLDFPRHRFAWIGVECVGGTCLYDGHVCENGRVIEQVSPQPDGHVRLLRLLGFSIDREFAPFARGFFETVPTMEAL